MLKMGLSSKQVSRDAGGFGWTQNFMESGGRLEFLKNPQQPRSQFPPLKCPRCDSLNTKFCYYNNYNRSQPRHFCKSCKRHWTKGGMLRNVPVGGGRKNKRHKTTNTKNKNSCKSVGVRQQLQQPQQQRQQQQQQINDCDGLARGAYLEMMTEGLGKRIGMNHPKNISELLNQAFIINPTLDYASNQNSLFVVAPNDEVSSSPVPLFNFTGLTTTFDDNPSSSSPPSSSFTRENQSSNVFNFSGEIDESTLDEDLINTTTMLMPPTSWQVPTTSSFVDPSSTPINWSWEDLNTLIATDLKQPWDDGNQNKQ